MPEDDYQAVPTYSRGPEGSGLVHWGTTGPDDPVIAAARWALAESLAFVYGDLVGGILEELTLGNVERWNGDAWVLVA